MPPLAFAESILADMMEPERLTRTAGGWDLTREMERLRSDSVSSADAVLQLLRRVADSLENPAMDGGATEDLESVEDRMRRLHEAEVGLASLRPRLANLNEMKFDMDAEEYQSKLNDITEQITRFEETQESMTRVGTLLDQQLHAVRTEAATRISAFGRMVVAMSRFRRKMQRRVAGTVSGSTVGSGGRASMRTSPSNAARQQSIVE